MNSPTQALLIESAWRLILERAATCAVLQVQAEANDDANAKLCSEFAYHDVGVLASELIQAVGGVWLGDGARKIGNVAPFNHIGFVNNRLVAYNGSVTYDPVDNLITSNHKAGPGWRPANFGLLHSVDRWGYSQCVESL